jgi:hypothetical protein
VLASHYRLPELFAGFGREEYQVPVRYPVACHPQAWTAGSVPHLVEVLLGLTPEAYERRLRIIRPMLPDFVDRLEVHRLQVGSARVNLRFGRLSELDFCPFGAATLQGQGRAALYPGKAGIMSNRCRVDRLGQQPMRSTTSDGRR